MSQPGKGMLRQLRMTAILIVFCLLPLPGGAARAQTPKTFREAFGNERATIFETLLPSLFPGAEARWAPNIVLHVAGGEDRPVDFAGFTYRKRPEGGWEGATGFEVGRDKEEYIFDASRFRTSGTRRFPTSFAIFRTGPDGHLSDFRKFVLDSSDLLTQVKAFDLQEWPNGGWPIVRIQYVSYYQQPETFTSIEWQALFDSNGGRLIQRLPMGIGQDFKDGREVAHVFSVERIDASHVRFLDSTSKSTVEYSCGDPCIVEGAKLLEEWAHSQVQSTP